ncbi:MAG: 30S ribosomal protein S1, partial [Thermodesulfobacteriota bacterium]
MVKEETQQQNQTDASETDVIEEESQQPEAGSENTETEEAAADPETEVADPGLTAEEALDAMEAEEEDAEMMEGETTMESLMDMYEESFKRFEEGEVAMGRIISVDKDHVLVDIGYKSEGQIPIREFRNEEGEIEAEVGDSVEVMVEWWDDEEEMVVLSKEKAEKVKVWDEIKKAYDDGGTVEGTITNRVKGGFSVDIGVQAFLPGSQADLRPIRNLDEMVGKTFTFKILKFNRKRSNIVLSRRVILEEEREQARAETLASIEEGKIMDGVVKNITEYGVFVDLGGVDGLLHITDISWGRVKHPSELFSVGDEITVKILNLDLERERVSLGMKQLTQDPWESAAEKYPVGSRVTGKVVSLTDYGAFVELEEGIEGLIHVSEMSWTRKIRHPSKVVTVGEDVDAIVLDIKPDSRRISLGMKQVKPNPWDVIGEKYPVGTTIEGKIKNITDFGAFIDLGGVDGLLHITDMSWGRVNHPSEIVALGEKLQVKVLDFNENKERISLGLKQLTEHPWKGIEEKYPEGARVRGKIVSITDYGAFMELEKGIEGLIHISEMSWTQHIKHPSKIVGIGDIVEAVVLKVDKDSQKISLGFKQLEPDPWENIACEFPIGTIISGKVRNIAAFGAFIELKEGVDGLIHISDMSWTRKINHPSDILKKGDTVEVKVLDIDEEKRRISLGLKQLSEDPWGELATQYGVGTEVEAEVARILDRGLIVNLTDEV